MAIVALWRDTGPFRKSFGFLILIALWRDTRPLGKSFGYIAIVALWRNARLLGKPYGSVIDNERCNEDHEGKQNIELGHFVVGCREADAS